MLKVHKGIGGQDTYYIKGVTVRFDFDAIRTSQLQTVSQEQSNGNVSCDVLYKPLIDIGYYRQYL